MEKKKHVSSGICGQRRPRSACASVQSNKGFHCPLIDLFDTTECRSTHQRHCWEFAHAQDDMTILRMLEVHFTSPQPLNLGGRRRTIDIFSIWSVFNWIFWTRKLIPVQALMSLSDFSSTSLFIGFLPFCLKEYFSHARGSEMRPYHLIFRILTIGGKLSCIPILSGACVRRQWRHCLSTKCSVVCNQDDPMTQLVGILKGFEC